MTTEPVKAWRLSELDGSAYLQHRLARVNDHLARVDAQLHSTRADRLRAASRADAARRKVEELGELVDELSHLRVAVEREQSEVLAELRQARKAGR